MALPARLRAIQYVQIALKDAPSSNISQFSLANVELNGGNKKYIKVVGERVFVSKSDYRGFSCLLSSIFSNYTYFPFTRAHNNTKIKLFSRAKSCIFSILFSFFFLMLNQIRVPIFSNSVQTSKSW